ncbi:MAG TPA: benzoate-CoA ligase family protein [Alphaproteobacteria bacterium]|nr:benzoate-CoA ligase family protein [Alphaproteobacteria bacterium]
MAAQIPADYDAATPSLDLPRDYNAAVDLIDRNIAAGRSDKIAVRDDKGAYSYGELAERVDRFAGALTGLGVGMEQRVVLCLLDTIDFPTAFLGAIKAGIVPIPVNTLLTTADYDFILRDSRATALIVSEPLLDAFSPILEKHPHLKHVIVSGADGRGRSRLSDLMSDAVPRFEAAATTCDDICFWLYSSGSTGTPKGTVHVHGSLIRTAELYARPVLGIREDDTVFSAAKLFFAYGLGNALTFPFAVGATAILLAERPTPAAVSRILREHRPTIFYGVPTLYGALLASPDLPQREEMALRRCASAGEALPADIGRRWTERTGVEILDGIGSTEMLHIFLSNWPGHVRYGTTGRPVPGYEVRVVDEAGAPVPAGEIGELQIAGPTCAAFYWNNRDRSRGTFLGPWTRGGDKYVESEDGYFTYCGRTDDMLKVGGIYVSPFEVEGALLSHDAVLEAAVIGQADERELVKPKAYVVLKPGIEATDSLTEALQQHVKALLAPYKYPRWIEFIDELPKTATGKIQRFKLRGTAGAEAASSPR